MGEVVNLRRVKKGLQRAEAAREAEANRTRYGRSKAERAAAEAEKAVTARLLDGARLERSDRDGEPRE